MYYFTSFYIILCIIQILYLIDIYVSIYLYIYTHMHTHCFFSLETLDYYRAKILVLYYLSVLLSCLPLFPFLSGAFWNHVTHLYTDAETSCVYSRPSVFAGDWFQGPSQIPNPQCFFKPLVENGLAENTVSTLIRGVHIQRIQELTEWRLPDEQALCSWGVEGKCSDICDIRQIMINSGGET